MDNRDAIIRKLAGIKAKMENAAATPAEIENATRIYNDLMQKYNISETDIHIKQEGITYKSFKAGAQGNKRSGFYRHEMFLIADAIARVTETKKMNLVRPDSGTAIMESLAFIGTRPDVDYAEFLFRLCSNSLEQAAKAFVGTLEYTRLIRMKVKPVDINRNFRAGFAITVIENLEKIALENERNKPKGNALVVLKKELIEAFIEKFNPTMSKQQGLTIFNHARLAAEFGSKEGDKVILRQQAGEVKKLADLRKD